MMISFPECEPPASPHHPFPVFELSPGTLPLSFGAVKSLPMRDEDSYARLLKTSDFDYELPHELIAQRPAASRDDSRLLVLDRATGAIQHLTFRDLPGLLLAGDLL